MACQSWTNIVIAINPQTSQRARMNLVGQITEELLKLGLSPQTQNRILIGDFSNPHG